MRKLLLPLILVMSCNQEQPKLTPPAPKDARVVINDYATELVNTHGRDVSPGRKQMIINMITDVAMTTLRTEDERKYWLALLGVESRYNNTAKSPVGAVGLGQLLPQYANDFGKSCGIAEVQQNDVQDSYTNAHLSACYFRLLIDKNHGSIPLALVAYNAGPSSADLKKAKMGAAMSNEPANYATKVWLTKTTGGKSEKVNSGGNR